MVRFLQEISLYKNNNIFSLWKRHKLKLNNEQTNITIIAKSIFFWMTLRLFMLLAASGKIILLIVKGMKRIMVKAGIAYWFVSAYILVEISLEILLILQK